MMLFAKTSVRPDLRNRLIDELEADSSRPAQAHGHDQHRVDVDEHVAPGRDIAAAVDATPDPLGRGPAA